MLFTRISLDSFPDVMSRYVERLEEDARLDGVSRKATISQVDWMIMGVVNIAGVLQYGSTSGIIRKALAQEGAERRKAQAQNADDEEGEDVGENLEEINGISNDTTLVPLQSPPAGDEPLPVTFTRYFPDFCGLWIQPCPSESYPRLSSSSQPLHHHYPDFSCHDVPSTSCRRPSLALRPMAIASRFHQFRQFLACGGKATGERCSPT